MFEIARLAGTPLRQIPLGTRRGTILVNVVASEPTERELRRAELLVRRQGRFWRQRKAPCGGYNCAGLVWAARRTALYEPPLDIIRNDDEYRVLPRESTPDVGDLAVYFSAESEFLHVGQVVDVMQITPGVGRLARVLSKWDDTTGEYFHSQADVPFDRHFAGWRIEFCTEREP
jgi:hypothetical protein